MTETDPRQIAERRADAKLGLATHALVYVLVNAGLATLNLITSPGHLWFIWPLFGWGLGLAAHALSVWGAASNLRERLIAEELKKIRDRPPTGRA